ncbi:MAG: hypothetical protein HYV28_13275 [Ignavibacteriales bacterium]|nr:hypothetical protein [Ignavibacteriales bacterium]
MIVEVNKIILIEDNADFHHRVTYTSSKLVDVDINLGNTDALFDQEFFEQRDMDAKVKPPIFSDGKIAPLLFNELDIHTLIILRIRPDHLLINTTISQNDIGIELLHDVKRNRLLYLFFSPTKKVLTIRPYIAIDDSGLLNKLKANLTDNYLRQSVLDLLTPKTFRDESANETPSNIGKNSISYKGSAYIFTYDGENYVFSNKQPVRDVVYIIKNKVSTDIEEEILQHWEASRKESRKESNKSSNAFDSFYKSYQRFKKEIQKQEKLRKVTEKNLLSDFFNNYLKMIPVEISIAYKPPKGFKWDFI